MSNRLGLWLDPWRVKRMKEHWVMLRLWGALGLMLLGIYIFGLNY